QHQNPRPGRLETHDPVASFSTVGSASVSSVADTTPLYDLIRPPEPTWPASVDGKKVNGVWRQGQSRLSSSSELVTVVASDGQVGIKRCPPGVAAFHREPWSERREAAVAES
ncbi:hypothetical protein, partial [Terrabacter sp. Soil811]|uniref:hypothetical protein n=1 Tax=Terrabacter sp. Soil811 TaxID=1736419 RepID=UPI001F34C400